MVTTTTNSIPNTLKRLHDEGYPVSENALRCWVKSGKIPAVYSGRRAYLWYPNVLAFLRGEATQGKKEDEIGIRRIQA